jgi:hypothetical protein
MKPDWTQPVGIDLHDIIVFRVYTNWGQKTVGFGQLDVGVKLLKEPGNLAMRIFGDSETMSREWTRKALHAVVDTVCNAMPEGKLDLSTPVDVPIPPEVLAHWDELDKLMGGDAAA